MAQKIIRFFTTMPGAILPLIGGIVVIAWFIAEGAQGSATPAPSAGANPAAISVNQLIELERKLGTQAQEQQQQRTQGYDQNQDVRLHY